MPQHTTSPRADKPHTSFSSPLHQLPFSFPSCRCFRELPKSIAPAKLLHPVLPAEAGGCVGHQLKEPHLHSPGTQVGQQHQLLQELLFLLPSQASRGRRPAPACRERPARPKGHLGTPKHSAGCTSGEGNASGSPMPEAVGPPRGLRCTTCTWWVPVPHHCWYRRALLSLYLICHPIATHAGFGSFSAP